MRPQAEPHPELERRYRRLLEWYPPRYRRGRRAVGLFAMAPAVRRRMLALLAPVAAMVAEQWAVLAVTPVLTFLLAAAAVHRADRRDELVHLGLAAERNAQ